MWTSPYEDDSDFLCCLLIKKNALKTFLYRSVLEFADIIISLKHYSDRYSK